MLTCCLLLRRNALEQFSYSLKSQVGDQEGLGGKLGADDKKSILDAVKSAQEWLETEGQTASAEEIDERREELQVRLGSAFALTRAQRLTVTVCAFSRPSSRPSRPSSTRRAAVPDRTTRCQTTTSSKRSLLQVMAVLGLHHRVRRRRKRGKEESGAECIETMRHDDQRQLSQLSFVLAACRRFSLQVDRAV